MSAAQYISRLRLTNFRNYATAALDCDQRHIVLTGANGAGKTNLIEALSLFSPGRGLRRAPFHTLSRVGGAKTDEPDWAVAISLETENGPVDMGTGSLKESPGRRVRINGANVKSIEQMSAYIRLLWLTPDMDSLFRGPASERRRFLDRLVITLIPDHNIALNAYDKAMRQRNRLLDEGGDAAWLDAIEAQMAQYSGAIYFSRIDALGHLQNLVHKSINRDAFPASTLALTPLFEDGQEPQSSSMAETELIKLWHDLRHLDRAAGRTTIGPHRVDLKVSHEQKSMPAALCSTGEQKALLIGLVLANAGLVKKMTQISPILLLDEIAAHLDPKRREALFSSLDALGTQCWMTGTDAMLFDALGDRALRFEVNEGRIMEQTH